MNTISLNDISNKTTVIYNVTKRGKRNKNEKGLAGRVEIKKISIITVTTIKNIHKQWKG